MKLFTLFADLVLDTGQFNKGVDQATRQGKTMASSLSGGFTMMSAKAVALGHAMYDVGKQAAKTAIDLSKQIISEYADAEQLIGGVQAIFGQSADTVLKNADNAFRTAGMSANEYMQTVTSFSSSLMKSLKGDTAEATRYADMAITDMSDNANRFGTDIGMIQNAYQGFAKQNYTMLDNLKLGYGGTQKEMQRLLKDAQKIQRANGVNVKYNINNLADVYEAIHVIQTEMGVTGTTAAEASETIAGSFNAFKSTWKNLLSGMAKDDADIDMLLKNMFDSGKTLLKNIFNVLPTIGQHAKAAFKFVTDKAKEAAPILYQTFKDTWDKKLPAIVLDGANGIIGIINSIFGTNIPKITSIDFPTWDEIESKFSSWWDGIKGSVEKGASWVLGIFNEPTATAEEMRAAISGWWTNTAQPAIEGMCTWVLGLFAPPSESEGDVRSVISAWWDKAGTWVSNACLWVLQMAGAPEETAEQAASIVGIWWDGIKDSVSAACTVIYHLAEGDVDSAVAEIENWWRKVKENISNIAEIIFKLLPQEAQEAIGTIRDWWERVKANSPDILSIAFKLLPQEVQDGITIIRGWWEKVKESDGNIATLIFKILPPDIQDAILAIRDWWDIVKEDYISIAKLAFEFLMPDLQDVIEAISDWWERVKKGVADIVTLSFEFLPPGIKEAIKAIQEMFTNAANMLSEYFGITTPTGSGKNGEGDAEPLRDPAVWVNEGTGAYGPATEQSYRENMAEIENSFAEFRDALDASLETFNANISGMPGEAASAAASALNGAKVEMDGATVGRLVLPYVSAGMSRSNRVSYKAAVAMK